MADGVLSDARKASTLLTQLGLSSTRSNWLSLVQAVSKASTLSPLTLQKVQRLLSPDTELENVVKLAAWQLFERQRVILERLIGCPLQEPPTAAQFLLACAYFMQDHMAFVHPDGTVHWEPQPHH